MRKLVLVLALGLLSCDTSDDSAAAVQKCQTLRASFCSRAVSCSTGLSQAQCEQAFAVGLDCGKAVNVGASYDRCVQEVSTFSCAILFPSGGMGALPASCNGVIGVSK